MSQKTHYDILEIQNNASSSDIKKAYRTLSLKWHPDRVEPHLREEAKHRFQEINAAYEILGDDNKRNQYDHELKFGIPTMGGGMDMGGMGGDDIHDIFNMFFGGGMPGMRGMPGMGGMPGMPGIHIFHMSGGGGEGGGGPPNMFQPGFTPNHLFEQFNKPPPLIKNVQITLENAYEGGNFSFDVERVHVQNGGVHTREIEKIEVEIPKGIDHGDILIKRGCGNSNEFTKGDVKLIVEIVPHPDFQRMGKDLVYKRKITLKEALCGISFEFRHLNKKQIQMNNMVNPVVICPGYKKVIPEFGMIHDQTQTRGNLIIEFEIVFPEKLSEAQISGLNQIL